MPKKKTALTIEERLQQAMVPAEEQPYEVPENWVWVRLENVASWGSGGTPSRKHEEYYNGDILWIKTGELNNGWIYDTEEKITDKGLKKSSAKLFPPYSVLIAMYGATIGKVAILGVPATTNQACACAVCNQSLLYMYLFYYCISQKNVFIEKGKGGAQPNISQIILKQHPIPLPPLSEQQRIVERIEELFAKLDEAKERLQEVADSFAVRKAGILHKAFTGELTKQWRRENGVSDESWEEITWGSFIEKIEAGKNWNALGRPPKNGEFGVVKVSAVTWGEFLEDESKTCTEESQWNEEKRISVGDFLFSRANTIQLVGNCVIVKDVKRKLMLSDKILRFSFSERVYDFFALWYTRTSSYRKQIESVASGNQDGMRNISQNNMKTIIFPLPTLSEQHEIVRLIDDLLARERSAQQATDRALASIDLMKKSILAHAFRGELGTNKASEASALELLRQVLAED